MSTYVGMYIQWLSSGLLKAKIVRKGFASNLCNVFRGCSFPTAVYLQKSLELAMGRHLVSGKGSDRIRIVRKG